MLLRSRPVASGPHFLVHAARVAAANGDPAGESRPDAGRLIVTAPRRVLRRAVERNAMRRVAREAWRACGLHRDPVIALLRVRSAFDVSALPGAGLPARKRLAREELDRLFAAAKGALQKRALQPGAPQPRGKLR